MKHVRRGLYILALVVLTVLTQIGGFALFVSTMVVWALVPEHKLSGLRAFPVHLFAFISVYAVLMAVVAPGMARIGGRVPLQCIASEALPYAAHSPLYCLFNRHYAVPQVKALLEQYSIEAASAHPGTVTAYLDAGFPLFSWFPMLPHLSHRDGASVDLAYYYKNEEGLYLPLRTPLPSGYFAFEGPRDGEAVQCTDGAEWFSMRWELDWLQALRAPYRLDQERTGFMLRWMIEFGREFGLSRVFIEPHLAARFGVVSDLIGFAGCHAARHDDHLHISLQPEG